MTAQDDITALQTQVAALTAQVMALTSAHAASVPPPAHTGPNMQHSEPFDSMNVRTRNFSESYQDWHTAAIDALIIESHSRFSCIFAAYYEAWGTDHPLANVGELTAMDTTITARAYLPGKGWMSCGQFEAYALPGATGELLTVNAEVKIQSDTGDVYGVVAHNDGQTSKRNGKAAFYANGDGVGGWDTGLQKDTPGPVVSAVGHDIVTVEPDGSTVVGFPNANITIRPDGNVGIDCTHLWINGEMQ